jgi:hypothetical protein
MGVARSAGSTKLIAPEPRAANDDKGETEGPEDRGSLSYVRTDYLSNAVSVPLPRALEAAS